MLDCGVDVVGVVMIMGIMVIVVVAVMAMAVAMVVVVVMGHRCFGGWWWGNGGVVQPWNDVIRVFGCDNKLVLEMGVY